MQDITSSLKEDLIFHHTYVQNYFLYQNLIFYVLLSQVKLKKHPVLYLFPRFRVLRVVFRQFLLQDLYQLYKNQLYIHLCFSVCEPLQGVFSDNHTTNVFLPVSYSFAGFSLILHYFYCTYTTFVWISLRLFVASRGWLAVMLYISSSTASGPPSPQEKAGFTASNEE